MFAIKQTKKTNNSQKSFTRIMSQIVGTRHVNCGNLHIKHQSEYPA